MSDTSATDSWSGERNFVTFKFPLVLGADDYHDFNEMASLLSFLSKTKVKFTEIENHGNYLQGDYPYHCMYYTAVFYINYTQEVAHCISEMKRAAEEKEAA